MSDAQKTIEILLQFKQSGQELLSQTVGLVKDLTNPLNLASGAFEGFANAGKSGLAGINASLATFRKELQSGELAVKVFSSAASTAFKGVELAAEGVWSAITFGASAVIKVVTSILGLLNPFSIQGLITGAALGGAGYVANEWIKAADSVETYRRQLAAVIGDQGIANRVFDDFQKLSQQSGVEAGKLAEVFTRLYELRVKDAEEATRTVAGVSAFLRVDIDELLGRLSNPSPRGLKQLGIDMNDLGKQVELVSGNMRVQVDKTEETIRQGLLDLLAQKFPNALQDAQKSFAVQMALLRIELGQYAQDFGAILLPAATHALEEINRFLRENKDNIVAVVRSIPQILGVMYDEISGFLNSGKIATTLGPILDSVKELALDFIGNLLRVMLDLFKLGMVPVVAAWRVLLTELQTAWEIFTGNLLPTLLNSIQHGIAAVANNSVVRAAFSAVVGPTLAGGPEGAKALFDAAGSLPDHEIRSIADATKDFPRQLDAALDSSFKDAKSYVGDLKQSVGDLFSYLKNDSQGATSAFLSIFSAGVQRVKDVVAATLDKMRDEESQNRSSLPAAVKEQPVDERTFGKIADLAFGGVYDQQLRTIKEKYQDELVAIEQNLQGKKDAELLYSIAKEALDKKQAEEEAQLLADLKIKHDELNASLLLGVQKEAADAQVAYEKDAANWQTALNQKLVTQTEFNDAAIARMIQYNEKVLSIYRQQRDAALQADLSAARANHDPAAAQNIQLQIEYEKQAEQLRQQRRDGLLDDQHYQEALTALEQSSAEKRLAINGNFFQGVELGFKQMADSIQSPAQIGMKVADDFASSFGDAFGQIVTGTKSVGDAFRAMAASILSDFAKMVAENGLKTFLSGLAGSSSAGGGIGGGIAGFIGSLFTAANTGGLIPGYAGGDVVGGGPWGPDRDSMLAALTPGEFVVRRQAVQQPGVLGLLRSINQGMPRISAAASSVGIANHVAAAAYAAQSGGASGAQSPVVTPAIVANESLMRSILAGGKGPLVDWMKSNWNLFAPRGGR